MVAAWLARAWKSRKKPCQARKKSVNPASKPKCRVNRSMTSGKPCWNWVAEMIPPRSTASTASMSPGLRRSQSSLEGRRISTLAESLGQVFTQLPQKMQ